MSSVTTQTGDSGTSGLMYGRRLPKTHPRFAALGSVDELNAALGFAKALACDSELKKSIEVVQGELIKLSMELATLPEDFMRTVASLLDAEAPARLHVQILDLEGKGAVCKQFIAPGRDGADAALHMARAICRRAERELWTLHEATPLPRILPQIYLNRLSDLLWVWSLYFAA
jgi:cob(I)alamin adenosyltransferase